MEPTLADLQLFTSIPGIVLAVLGVICVIMSLIAFARITYQRARVEQLEKQIELLRGDRDDYSARLERVVDEKKQLELDLKEACSRVDALEKSVRGTEELHQIILLLNHLVPIVDRINERVSSA